ncbi:MAG: ABC transporter permease subunit [Rhodospirillales bacterium]|nr:ABC transporter permease subunit [Rhodospirillales bacterium]
MSETDTISTNRFFGTKKDMLLIISGFLVVAISIAVAVTTTGEQDFPSVVIENFPFADWINLGEDWLKKNYRWLTRAISHGIGSGLDTVETFLILLSWPITVITIALIALGTGGLRLALFCIFASMSWGTFGMWDSAMETLSLMIVAVAIAVTFGVLLGIAASLNDRIEAFLRPVLDTMQTMPSFVYLIPAVFFFGIGGAPAVLATVIYAIPPAVRMTNLGIRQVPINTIEAARSFGSTPLQILLKVKLPLALPSIMMGINQTVMMALGMVVIATFIGAAGLGYEVWQALRQLKIGWSLEGGLSIVLMAIIFDRISYAMSDESRQQASSHEGFRLLPARMEDVGWARSFEQGLGVVCALFSCGARAFTGIIANGLGTITGLVSKEAGDDLKILINGCPVLVTSAAIVISVYLFDGYVASFGDFPKAWHLSIRDPADAALEWLKVNHIFIAITTWIRWFVFAWMLDPLADFLVALPWWYAIALMTGLVYYWAGPRLALVTLASLVFIGATGLWAVAMFTLATILVAALLCAVIGIPLGILMAVNDVFEAIMRPILDTMQTLPAFVYLVPVLMFFGGNVVSAVIATMVYAIPPLIRLTNLGLREVATDSIEAATSYGSTFTQILVKVKLPLALPSIMMGINQCVMMALAMTVITPLIGGGGLGQEVFNALASVNTGEGLEAGLSIVLIAVILDRLTQAWSKHRREALGL